MTLDEFIERLAGTKRDGWHIGVYRRLRCKCLCPIEYVAGFPFDSVMRASELLGLSRADREAIMDAADHTVGVAGELTFDPALRSRLLSAVGLAP